VSALATPAGAMATNPIRNTDAVIRLYLERICVFMVLFPQLQDKVRLLRVTVLVLSGD